MAEVVLFLHGMGKHEKDWIDAHTKLLSSYTHMDFLPLSYSDVVERKALWVLGEAEQSAAISAAAVREEVEIAYAEGYLAARLGMESQPLQLEPMGNLPQITPGTAMDAYKYASRYLVNRRVVRDAVFDTIQRQFMCIVSESQPKTGSLTLLCHSLGCAVGLDVMAKKELARYVCRFITVGSPLGWIGTVRWLNRRMLPIERRSVTVPWIDIVTADDPVVHGRRVGTADGFDGNPLNMWPQLPKGFQNPHSAYFHEEDAVRQWYRALTTG